MHDIRAIRENPAAFDAALARRGLPAMSANILALDETRRARIHAAETAQAEQNKASKEVGAAKAKGDEAEFERLRALVAEKKAEVARQSAEAAQQDAALTADRRHRLLQFRPVVGTARGADLHEDASEVVPIGLRPRLNALLLVRQTHPVLVLH